jgi:hypothetical protein
VRLPVSRERKVFRFSCMERFLCTAFAQSTCWECFRDIQTCRDADQPKPYNKVNPQMDLAKHASQCQRETRLATLRPLRPDADTYGPSLLTPSPWRWTKQCSPQLRDDRFASFPVPVGLVPDERRRRQDAYVVRLAREHLFVHQDHRRQSDRCKHQQRSCPGTRTLLHTG